MQELIEACKSQNVFAQRRLFDTYAKRLLRLCLRYVGEMADAEEVMMDGFLKIYDGLHRLEYRDQLSFEAWMKRIMVNESLMFLRKQRKLMVTISTEESVEIADSYSSLITDCDAELLLTMICQLPYGYRTVFNLYAIEGFSHQEIAQKLSINEGTSKSQLSKARLMLQQMWIKHERANIK